MHDIKQYWLNILENARANDINDNIELECRIRNYIHEGGNKDKPIPYKIITNLERKFNMTLLSEGWFTVSYYSNINNNKYNVKEFSDDKTELTYKQIIGTETYNNLGIKIDMVYETVINNIHIGAINTTVDKISTLKYRKLKYRNLIIDIRYYTNTKNILVIKNIELEHESNTITDIMNTYNEWFDNIVKIIAFINNTDLIYTKDEYNNISTLISKNKITDNLVNPITLTRHNLRSEYLFNTLKVSKYPKKSSIKLVTYTFFVGYKTDGVRGILILHRNNLWWISSRINFSLISKISGIYPNKTVALESELILFKPNSKRFYVFDILYDSMFTTDKIREIEYKNRIKLYNQNVAELNKYIDNDLVKIYPKRFEYIGVSFASFTKIMSKMLDLIDKQPYPTDGIIFVPNEIPNIRYMVQNSSVDFLKWKPVKLVTIDLLYEDNTLKWSVGKKQLQIDISDYNVVYDMENRPNGIYEFEVVYNSDNNTLNLISIRRRLDKQYPNSRHVVNININMVVKPIRKEDIIGLSSSLYRYHMSKIRTDFGKLFSHENSILLDIGGGYGSMVNVYNEYRYVVVIEPKEDNLIELKRRIISKGLIIDTKSSPIRQRGHVLVLNGYLGDKEIMETLNKYPFNTIYVFNVIHFMTDIEMDYIYNSLIPNMSKKFTSIVGISIDGNKAINVIPNSGSIVFDDVHKVTRHDNLLNFKVDMPTLKNQSENLVDLLGIINNMYTKFSEFIKGKSRVNTLSLEDNSSLMSIPYKTLLSLYYGFSISNIDENIGKRNKLVENNAMILPIISDDEIVDIDINKYFLIGCIDNHIIHCLLKLFCNSYSKTSNIVFRNTIFDEWIESASKLYNIESNTLKYLTYSKNKIIKLSEIFNINIGICYMKPNDSNIYLKLHSNKCSGFICLLFSDGKKFSIMCKMGINSMKTVLYNQDRILDNDIFIVDNI